MSMLQDLSGRGHIYPEIDAFTPRVKLALLARILSRHGFSDHNFGHITHRLDDGTLLMNPFELAWDEVRASDVLRLDTDGELLEGDWSVNIAAELHLALHRMRPDARWAVHNHSEWATIYSALHRRPPAYDQMSCTIPEDDLIVYDDYPGPVYEVDWAEANIRALGEKNYAILANHGVMIVAHNWRYAHQRSIVLERRCRIAWSVEAIGGGVPIKPEIAAEFAAGNLRRGGAPHTLELAIRRELGGDPSVLD